VRNTKILRNVPFICTIVRRKSSQVKELADIHCFLTHFLKTYGNENQKIINT